MRAAAVMTSVPPVADRRLAAIVPAVLGSFEANGFDAILLNAADEVDRVRALYPGATVVPAAAGVAPIFEGRFGPTFGALFGAAGDYRIIGICNADTLLLPSDIRARVEREPATFFAAHRLDIDRLGGEVVGVYRRGVDAVFFDRERFAPLLEDENFARFQLGAPLWDNILPVLASFHGRVAFVEPPFLLHEVHETRWSAADQEAMLSHALTTVVGHARRHAATSPRARAFLKIYERYVGDGVDGRSPRRVRRAMRILRLWVEALERTGSVRLSVEVAGALSASAKAELGRQSALAGAAPSPAHVALPARAIRGAAVWAKRLGEVSRRRLERALAEGLNSA